MWTLTNTPPYDLLKGEGFIKSEVDIKDVGVWYLESFEFGIFGCRDLQLRDFWDRAK